MSKKDKIVELLKKDTSVEDICIELGVSTSYVYRIQREINESQGDNENSTESKTDHTDDLAVGSTGGDGANVDKNNENVEPKETEGETNNTERLGGVKKKRKRSKKKIVEKTEQSEHKSGGIKEWIKNQWKKMLLILTFLILLIMIMLSPSKTKQEQPRPMEHPRFPMLNH